MSPKRLHAATDTLAARLAAIARALETAPGRDPATDAMPSPKHACFALGCVYLLFARQGIPAVEVSP